MCRTCGCEGAVHAHDHEHAHDHSHSHDHSHAHAHSHPHEHRRVSLETDLLAKNDRLAGALRARFEHDAIAVLNLIGAPGAGKTTLLEHTLRMLSDVPIGVIEGDQATDHDARRIAATGRKVTQVNTGPGCHLEADMIERSLAPLGLGRRSLLFIENVGNLVCPALFDLGESAKVVVVSITEGEDKPLKYPHVYRAAGAMIVTKVDLAPHVDVDPAKLVENARRVNPHLAVFSVAATRGEGLGEWCGWLRAQIEDRR
jgi:hydrogenase nickel incorporation protein HypB